MHKVVHPIGPFTAPDFKYHPLKKFSPRQWFDYLHVLQKGGEFPAWAAELDDCPVCVAYGHVSGFRRPCHLCRPGQRYISCVDIPEEHKVIRLFIKLEEAGALG